jgi:YD repeat-containing protein
MRKAITLFKICLLVPFLLPVALVVNGQSTAPTSLNPTLSNVLPPSPNVSALSKFGSIPVGQSTGIPQISVPIYQYSNKNTGLSLNVSINYHAGGVRVDEMASNVGLGWALSAGGAVSRVVRGLPDESPSGFWNTPYVEESNGNYPIKDGPFLRATRGFTDLEADIFSYTINGRSGKFTYGRNGQILLIDDNKLKIEKTIGTISFLSTTQPSITSFTITDEQGTQYVFAVAEITKPATALINAYRSSWQLTSIQSATGRDKITFEYKDVAILPYTTSLSQTITGPMYPTSIDFVSSSTSSQQMTLDAKALKKIAFPNGTTIQFDYETTQRQDLPGDYLLHQITLQDAKSQMARGFILKQDYSLSQRATLLTVVPFSGLTATLRDSPYQFFYNPGLPARLSNRQDHWGYPIGYPIDASDRRTLIPREIFSDNIGADDNGPKYEIPGINRDTDARTCMAGTLNRIQYPTGGHTDFELEANQAVDGWLSQNFSVTLPSTITNRVENTVLSVYDNSPPYKDSYFTFNGTKGGYVEFSLSISKVYAPEVPNGPGILRVEVFPTTGLTQNSIAHVDFTYPFATTEQNTKLFTLPEVGAQGTQYRLRFYFNNLGIKNLSANQAQLRWIENTSQTQVQTYSHNQAYVGGLRVKKIADYDGISTEPVSVRQYAYVKEDGTSSGVLASYPTYTHKVYYKGDPRDIPDSYTPKGPLVYVRESSSANDVVYTNGSPVTYSRIVETQLNSTGTNGKTERLFTTVTPRSKGSFPYVPQQSYDWEGGLLLQENVYDAKGTLLKKTQNRYAVKFLPDYNSTAEIQNFTSYTTTPVGFQIPRDYQQSDVGPGVANYTPYWFLSEDYLPRAGRSDLTSTVTTTYDPTGANAIVETVAYDYDPVYYYLKRKRYTDSNKQPLTEEYTYAADKVSAGATSPYSTMVSKNIINPVLETSRTVNGVKLLASITNYQAGRSANTEAILPASVQSQFRTEAPEVRLRYDRYDDNGNPLSQRREHEVKTCYVWGYNKQYPVAEIKNIDYATLEAVLGGAQAIADFGNLVYPDDNTVKSFLAVLRTDARLAKSLVTTSTYAPLAGITSFMDPSGRSTLFEYDGFQRLLRTRDEKGRILSQQQYHYAGK